jgi:hypothetical protein
MSSTPPPPSLCRYFSQLPYPSLSELRSSEANGADSDGQGLAGEEADDREAVLRYLFEELKTFAMRGGTKRQGISGLQGPYVRAIMPSSQRPLPPPLSHLVRAAVHVGAISPSTIIHQISVNYYDSKDARMVPHKDGRGKCNLLFSFGHQTTLRFFYRPTEKSEYTLVFGDLEETTCVKKDGSREGKGEQENQNEREKDTKEKKEDGKNVGDESGKEEKEAVDYLLEGGSLLCVDEEAFTDWAHAIEKKEADVIHPRLSNFSLLSPSLTSTPSLSLPRGPRVSVVIWPE